MKRFIVLLLSFVMIFSTFCVSNAVEISDDLLPDIIQGDIMAISEGGALIAPNPNAPIRVKLDDQFIDFTDANGNVVNPQIINDRTMVPFRKIFNSLGVSDENITYTSSEEPIIAKNENIEIRLQIGNTTAQKIVDGVTTDISLDSAPVIVDGRTLVPVRFIAESLEKKVGWDATNRTVIIIDAEKLLADLQAASPKYFKLLELQTIVPTTYDIDVDLDGTIDYTDSKDKSNNTKVNIAGTVDMTKSSNAISFDLDVKLAGKGVLIDSIKSSGLENIDLTMIVENDTVYYKSSLFDNQTDGKWLKTKNENIGKMMETANEVSDINENNLINIDEDSLTIYTYETYKMIVDMFKEFLGDDKLTVTEGKTTKYEWKYDLDDILALLKNNDVDAEEITDNIKKFELLVNGTIKDGVSDASNASIKLEFAEANETAKIEFNAKAKIKSYNKTYTISTPSNENVIDIDNMQ